jgi:hypothetical protein
LADEIARQLTEGRGHVVRCFSNVDDVARWRRAARMAGRSLRTRICTGISCDGQRVWAVEEV